MRYSKTHEWVLVEGKIATIGITEYAQKELGEVVYIELPKEGMDIKIGEEVCVLESTKAAADIYTPLSGKIVSTNLFLKENCSAINHSPEEKGWLFKLEITHPEELEDLVDRVSYYALVD